MKLRTVIKIQRRGRWASDASASIQQVRGAVQDLRGVCQRKLRTLLPQWYVPDAKRADQQVKGLFQKQAFLSCFGGRARAVEFVQKEGGAAMVVDYEHSSTNDTSKFSVWNQTHAIIHLFQSIIDLFQYGGIGLPWNTSSRSRRAPPGSRIPQALRGDSETEIFGLSKLKPSDFDKVQAAKRMYHGAIKLIRRCLKLGICGYLENPLTSRVS